MDDSTTQQVALENGPVEIIGALDFDRSPTGIGPRRLPAWTRRRIPDPFMEAMVASTSGVRLAFNTNSDTIELDVMVTSFRYTNGRVPSIAFQLVRPDRPTLDAVASSANFFVIDPSAPNDIGFEAGEPTTIRFSGLGSDARDVELWLPNNASVELRALRIDATASVDAPTPSAAPVWLHYGSSISHCMEAETPTQTWPAVAARLGGVRLFSLGLAGQCQLDQFVARTIRDLPADVISLKLGINIVNGDTMRERTFVPAVHGLLDTIRDGHPDTPVLVVSPIFCPSAEEHPGPSVQMPDGTFGIVPGMDEIRNGCLTLQRVRVLLGNIVDARRAAGDTNLAYLDGLQLFGPDDVGDLPDLLHPNTAGYVRMGERFAAAAFTPGGPLSSP